MRVNLPRSGRISRKSSKVRTPLSASLELSGERFDDVGNLVLLAAGQTVHALENLADSARRAARLTDLQCLAADQFVQRDV